MVQASPTPGDVSNYNSFLRKLITFRAPGPEGAEQEWEGVLVQIVVGPDASKARGSPELLRVLHSDGMVRLWGAHEVSKVECVHPDAPYTKEDVDFKVDRSIFRGGTRQTRQLTGEALLSKEVELWDELSRAWRRAKVIRDENGEVSVSFDDNTEATLTDEDVWRMLGEDADDGILKEKEQTILESPHVKCIVSHVPEKGLVHIYKLISSPKMPFIKTSKTVACIEEQADNGETIKTVIELPHPADLTKCVDGVMDMENWLRLTYTQAQE